MSGLGGETGSLGSGKGDLLIFGARNERATAGPAPQLLVHRRRRSPGCWVAAAKVGTLGAVEPLEGLSTRPCGPCALLPSGFRVFTTKTPQLSRGASATR